MGSISCSRRKRMPFAGREWLRRGPDRPEQAPGIMKPSTRATGSVPGTRNDLALSIAARSLATMAIGSRGVTYAWVAACFTRAWREESRGMISSP
jgi:hypothetical protein